MKSRILEIRERLSSGQSTAVQELDHCLAAIEEKNPQINAFLSVNENAKARAEAMDLENSANSNSSKNGVLAGVPVAVKDLFCHRGMPTTAASKILEGFVSPYSSTVTQRLEDAGAVLIGKTNLDEFGMGSSNENSSRGVVKNPHSPEHVAGGSSGGSAAAVAGGMAPVAIGTDTGGSIRQPASFCGLVGVKPTYGRVSRYGMVAFASSCDQAGPMTSTVDDSARLLEVMAGHDPKDATSSALEVPRWSEKTDPELKGRRVGVIREFSLESAAPEVQQGFGDALEYLRSNGAEVIEVSLPSVKYAVPAYYVITTAEASSNLARYDGVRFGWRKDLSESPQKDLEALYGSTRSEGFGREVKRRILLGTYALSEGYYDAYYMKASRVRRMILEDFQKAFAECEVLVSPVTLTAAFRLGEKIKDPLAMYMNDVFTTSANLAGIPAASVPVGKNSNGLPLGLQIMAPHFAEQKLFDFARAFEMRRDWREVSFDGL